MLRLSDRPLAPDTARETRVVHQWARRRIGVVPPLGAPMVVAGSGPGGSAKSGWRGADLFFCLCLMWRVLLLWRCGAGPDDEVFTHTFVGSLGTSA